MRTILLTIVLIFSLTHILGQTEMQKLTISHLTGDFYIYTTYNTYKEYQLLNEWTSTIKKLQNKFKKPRFIIPGHNDWTSKKALSHTLKLIKQHKKKNYQ